MKNDQMNVIFLIFQETSNTMIHPRVHHKVETNQRRAKAVLSDPFVNSINWT